MENFVKHGVFPGKKVNLPRNSCNLFTFIFHNIWIGVLFLSVVRYFIFWYGATPVLTFLFALAVAGKCLEGEMCCVLSNCCTLLTSTTIAFSHEQFFRRL